MLILGENQGLTVGVLPNSAKQFRDVHELVGVGVGAVLIVKKGGSHYHFLDLLFSNHITRSIHDGTAATARNQVQRRRRDV